MPNEKIAAFAEATTALRAAKDKLLDEAETLLPLIAAVKARVSDCDFIVAGLRRSSDVGQGPLNSVSAVQQSHRGLAAALEDFNQHVLRLFDIRRELEVLHPAVVNALTPLATEGVTS